jgi:hypothetical protein
MICSYYDKCMANFKSVGFDKKGIQFKLILDVKEIRYVVKIQPIRFIIYYNKRGL